MELSSSQVIKNGFKQLHLLLQKCRFLLFQIIVKAPLSFLLYINCMKSRLIHLVNILEPSRNLMDNQFFMVLYLQRVYESFWTFWVFYLVEKVQFVDKTQFFDQSPGIALVTVLNICGQTFGNLDDIHIFMPKFNILRVFLAPNILILKKVEISKIVFSFWSLHILRKSFKV